MRPDEVMKVMDKRYTQDCTLGTRRYVETLNFFVLVLAAVIF